MPICAILYFSIIWSFLGGRLEIALPYRMFIPSFDPSLWPYPRPFDPYLDPSTSPHDPVTKPPDPRPDFVYFRDRDVGLTLRFDSVCKQRGRILLGRTYTTNETYENEFLNKFQVKLEAQQLQGVANPTEPNAKSHKIRR